MMGGERDGELNLRGKRATVLGLAREGTALVRFLVEQGAIVTATDLKTEQNLAQALADLAGLPVRYLLGGHPSEVLDTDVLFVSPGVPVDAPIMVQARQRGLLMSNESRLFSRLCPAAIAGITGSSGKTTTATLVSKMLEVGGKRAHLGGNIGSPLIGRLSQIASQDVVVMELSSFQLDFWGPVLEAEPRGDLRSPLFPPGGWSPPAAAVLNVTPNHLDRHPTMASYAEAKMKIVRYQRPQDLAVLGWDDPVARSFAEVCPGQVAYFSLAQAVPRGACGRGDLLMLREGSSEATICSKGDVRLRGEHNVANVLAACAVAAWFGVSPAAMASVASSFSGVEHRLEAVRQLRGVSYYNDSIATSPERAMAALRSFSEPIVLLAGGRDKHLPWDGWADLASRKAVQVIAFGEAAALIQKALSRLGSKAPPMRQVESVAEAVELAQMLAQPGQVVLFAPGGTSFDAFHDYAERGDVFKRLVLALPSEAG